MLSHGKEEEEEEEAASSAPSGPARVCACVCVCARVSVKCVVRAGASCVGRSGGAGGERLLPSARPGESPCRDLARFGGSVAEVSGAGKGLDCRERG